MTTSSVGLRTAPIGGLIPVTPGVLYSFLASYRTGLGYLGPKIRHVGAPVSTTGATLTVVLPEHQVGDILLVPVVGRPNATTGTFATPPGGWAQVSTAQVFQEVGAVDLMLQLFYKIAASEAETNPAFTIAAGMQGGAAGCSGVGISINGVDTASPFLLLPITGAAAANTFTQTNLASTQEDSLLLNFVGTADDNALTLSVPNGWVSAGASVPYAVATGGNHAAGVAAIERDAITSVNGPTWNQSTLGPDAWVSISVAIMRLPLSLRLAMAWYQNDGSTPSAITARSVQGAFTAMTYDGVYGELVYEDIAAPADALYVYPQVDIRGPFAASAHLDRLAFAEAEFATWSPGSVIERIYFIVERSEDGGDTWLPVYGYSRELAGEDQDPVASENTIADRASANGIVGIQYQAYAVAVSADGEIFSLPNRNTDAPNVKATQWWLRDLDDPTLDVAVLVPEASRSWGATLTEWEQQGAEYPKVRYSTLPDKNKLNFSCMVLDSSSYLKVKALLHKKVPLIVQSNLDGMKWYVEVVSEVSETPVRASVLVEGPSYVRNVHEFSCTMRVVGVQ